MQDQSLVSRIETAQQINCSIPTVSAYVHRGWLDGIRLGKRLMIKSESIQRLLAHGTAPVQRRPKNG